MHQTRLCRMTWIKYKYDIQIILWSNIYNNINVDVWEEMPRISRFVPYLLLISGCTIQENKACSFYQFHTQECGGQNFEKRAEKSFWETREFFKAVIFLICNIDQISGLSGRHLPHSICVWYYWCLLFLLYYWLMAWKSPLWLPTN